MTRLRNPSKSHCQDSPQPAVVPSAAVPSRAAQATELTAWLRLTLTPGIGPGSAITLLRHFRSPHGILHASHAELARIVGAGKASKLLHPDDALKHAVAQTLAWQTQPDCHLVCLDDPRYPQPLLQIADPPAVLYLRGQPAVLNLPALGVIGARHATRAGLDNATAFASHLSSRGLVVVSGLARGIDGAAHIGAMQNNGQTLAVMGTGIDRIYPAAHRQLASEISAHGAILTEMPLGTTPRPGHFPRRNRLIAGLSLGVLVVEAARRSGSLITARHALECGREVFAIPGSIHSPVARGCHRLIRQGAKLVESAQDIIDELPPAIASRLIPTATANPDDAACAPPGSCTLPAPFQALLKYLDWDGMTMTQLQQRMTTAEGTSLPNVAQSLLELELAGYIERFADGRVRRRGMPTDSTPTRVTGKHRQ